MTVLLGAVADDFTGATDLASMLARGGMRTVLRLGAPDADEPAPGAEAVVVALKSRTAPVEEAVAQSVASWRWAAQAGAEQCYFKYCSTFDSTPHGNIGPVAEALMAATGAVQTIYCPAFPENGRTIYQGKLFVFDQLLSESGMRNHPLTPMTDADLRRVLGTQLSDGAEVGLVPWATVVRGAGAIREALAALAASGAAHVIVDALTDADLAALGQAVADMPLVTAASGLGLGLAASFGAAGRLAGGQPDALPQIGGETLLLSGSCSTATNDQVARWRNDGAALMQLDPLALADGQETADSVMDWLRGQAGPALIAATQPPDAVEAAQRALGRNRAAALVEDTLATIAVMARGAGTRRFVVAGGETSGAVAKALGAERLAVGPSIAPGVPWCATLGPNPVALALKSGNFGGETFFADALESAP
ncbi:MAG: four-carbon acid sugar kinase family protein [Paracoccaceae bacterium]|nr:four-carbon acid sugar kinase family protein [Paracoccaceae bacterium]